MLKTSVRKYLQQVALVAIPSSFFFLSMKGEIKCMDF